MQNKANFPHFSPKNDDFTKNKPNLSQLKPIQSQFVERGKIDAKFSYTRAYEENAAMGQENKANSNPTCSELVEPIKANFHARVEWANSITPNKRIRVKKLLR